MFAGVSDAKLTGPELLEAAVAIWTFEGTERNKDNDPFVKDVSGNGHDAVMLNKPALVDGQFGKAVEFNAGRKNYLEVPHHEDFDLDEAISISVWVKSDRRDYKHSISHPILFSKKAENGSTVAPLLE